MPELSLAPPVEAPAALSSRPFLLLQGPSSPFFSDLGSALGAEGATVARIGFCPGDRLFWKRRAGAYHAYRGKMDAFGHWLARFVEEHRISDIVMLGDGREPHAAAIEAKQAGALTSNIWIVEHGYLRPNLVLVEPDGMGGSSRIPERYEPGLHVEVSPQTPGWSSSFLRYAAFDVAYHASNVLLAPFFYPNYRPHSGIAPAKEYMSWVLKGARLPIRRRARRLAEARIERHDGPLFLFPLQLSQDFQVRRYGTGDDQRTVLHEVIGSFLKNAPPDALLVIKIHPLDNGLTDWAREIAQHAAGGSIVLIDGGNLDALIRRADGVVTINSTVGLSAILEGCSTHVLGQAVYRLPGLVHDGTLADFWGGAAPPDSELAADFGRYLRAIWHVPGAFDGAGSAVGARALVTWLTAPPYRKVMAQ